jgi:hypothetical protein
MLKIKDVLIELVLKAPTRSATALTRSGVSTRQYAQLLHREDPRGALKHYRLRGRRSIPCHPEHAHSSIRKGKNQIDKYPEWDSSKSCHDVIRPILFIHP